MGRILVRTLRRMEEGGCPNRLGPIVRLHYRHAGGGKDHGVLHGEGLPAVPRGRTQRRCVSLRLLRRTGTPAWEHHVGFMGDYEELGTLCRFWSAKGRMERDVRALRVLGVLRRRLP